MPRSQLALGLVVALACIGLRADSQTNDAAARYTATAINMEAPAGAVATPIEIYIERWSTDQERDQVMNTLLEGTPAKLLDVVRHLPRIGTIHTPGNIGWDLRYARHSGGSDGRDRVTILTDRPIGFWEAREQPRSIDYPFTVIELRVGSNGRGEGTVTVGTKVTMDKATGTLILENYNIQPITLGNVRKDK
jgi:hypothetical protein